MQRDNFGIRELAEQAKREGAFDLAQGVIDTPPPSVLGESLKTLSVDKCSFYNNRRGVESFRRAVSSYLAARQWHVDVESVIGTAGVTGATAGALLSHCRPGAKVLLAEPFFIGHKLLLETLGFSIDYFSVLLDAPPDWEALEQKMSTVAAVILTTPANPTGQVAPHEVLCRLSRTAAQHDCLLLIDEMYREFIWDTPLPDDSSYAELDFTNTVLMRSFSKTFAIPGWRVGFAITSPERVESMAVQHDALYLGSSTIAQYALAKALTQHLPELNNYVDQLREQLQQQRDLLAIAFRAHGMEPLPVPATYYMLLKHNRSSDRAAFEELVAKKIIVVPMNILFSDSSKDTGYIRIHFAVSPETAQRVMEILTVS